MIEFRGKQFEHGQWRYGALINVDPQITYIRENTYTEGWGYQTYCVDKETIGIYFGVTDRQRVKIFTGDILKERTTDELFVVQYNQLHCCFGLFDRTNQYKRSITANPYMNYRLDDYINMGNIHDNPELLEGEI